MIYRHTANGANGGYLVEAARAVRAGPTPPLGRILTTESSVEVEREYGQYPLNARSYAGVSYLAEQYGPDLLGQILRESRGTSPDRVHALIQQRTGLSIEALDQAVSQWLLGLRRVDGTSGDGRIAVEMLLHADGRHGEALVDETSAACAFDVADREVPNAPGLVGFSVALNADGSFTSARPSPRVGNTVTLAGRLDESGKLVGTYQVVNEATGCDSGPIAFQSP
jgi:hypothetical protein